MGLLVVALCMVFTFLAFHDFANAATTSAVASALERSRALLVVAFAVGTFALEVFPLLLLLIIIILGLSLLVAVVAAVAQAAAYGRHAGTAAL